MAMPIHEPSESNNILQNVSSQSSEEEHTFIGDGDLDNDRHRLAVNTTHEYDPQQGFPQLASPSQAREQEKRFDDDLAVLEAERVVSNSQNADLTHTESISRLKSKRSEPVDDFDVNTNPIHEKNSVFRPPKDPATKSAKLFKKIHNSSFLVRYFTYITPLVLLLLVPLLLGALLFKNATVGGVSLMWFAIWLEIVWLTLWAGRIVAKAIPWPMGLLSSLFTNNSKKWRDMGKQLELPAAIFFWALAVEISFLPTMRSHMVPGYQGDTSWQITVNRVIVSILVGATLNFVEKIIIQLVAISFHLRTYADRIELNNFQIGSLVKLYKYSKEKIAMEDSEFEENGNTSGVVSGTRTPRAMIEKAQKNFSEAFTKVGDVAGKVAGDFTGRQVTRSTHPHQVVLTLLNATSGSQVLARRLYRTFVREGTDTVLSEDMKPAFDNDEEAEAAFTMFDKDLNGDISMEELEAVCVEIGRERKSITASLKDLDSVVSKLDAVLLFIVVFVTILVFITLISTSAAGVLTSAGSSILALSWLFSATAQEFLQSLIFVFLKHPYDVGDRVTIYGNTGSAMKGDDYFVKEIALLYTEFKKMEGHLVQAPNSYLNTLFILNMRRSGGLAEAVAVTVKFGTTLEQFEELRNRLLEFVKAEKREYQGNILTEIRDVVEVHSINLNVVFFYKSNWQNELLRLQRRNKFICAMMVIMQEVGIEGPRMRIAGQRDELPFYVQYPSNRTTDNNANYNNSDPYSSSTSREAAFVPSAGDIPQNRGSISRQPGSVTRPRVRGESISAMAKRVDFSLGMKDISSGDMMSDLFEDENKPRLPDYSRSSRSRSNNRTAEEDAGDTISSIGHTTSRETPSIRTRFSLRRSETDLESGVGRRNSTVHRNRFFGRRARPSMDAGGADEVLMEQGMADIPESMPMPRHSDVKTGRAGPKARRTSTEEIAARPSRGYLSHEERSVGRVPMRTTTENLEMRSLDR